MKLLYILILLSISYKISSQGDWRHIYAGLGISALSAEITNQFLHKPLLSSTIGLSLGCSAGWLKENWYDKKLSKGIYNKWDIYDTSYGAILGMLVINVKFDIDKNKNRNKKIHYEY